MVFVLIYKSLDLFNRIGDKNAFSAITIFPWLDNPDIFLPFFCFLFKDFKVFGIRFLDMIRQRQILKKIFLFKCLVFAHVVK